MKLIHRNVFPYKCQFCSKMFKHWNVRQDHIRYQHMVERPFKCPICNKGYIKQCEVQDHIRSVHTKG
jgi:transcription elongation factor Elf1